MSVERSWMEGTPKAVLLATDLSARCDRALDRAVTLAVQWQAKLVAVHAMEAPARVEEAEVPSWRRAADPQRMAEARIRSELREMSPELAVVVETGDSVEAILRTAASQRSGLIVTGVSRDELLGRLVLGNTVSRLVRRSALPVLVVRKRGLQPYRHVVVATDFSESSRHALEASTRFFPDTVLTLFNACDAPMAGLAMDPASFREQFRIAAQKEAAAFLGASDLSAFKGPRPEVLVEHGDPERLIYEYVQHMGVDLVVVGSHGRSALFDVMIGSVAQGLLTQLPCDVLVVREPRAKAG
ncbi:MAG TPA: universal stress protein [Hyphomicrobiaceae bacterium]|nr:universal stress protein [Hyphomicrobiaceae bacterium]